MLPEHSVSLVRSHVEQAFCLAKAAGDVVTRLVGIAVVDVWEFRVIVDQQQRRGYADDRAWQIPFGQY